MKSQSNLLNPLDPEIFLCEGRCGERANMVREALKILQEESDKSDVLGYISSGRGMVNSAAFLGNSGVSLAKKTGNMLYNAPSAAYSVGKTVGNVAMDPRAAASSFLNAVNSAPTAIGNKLNYTGNNMLKSANAVGTVVGNSLTRMFTPKAQAPTGGRRRRRTRRR